MRRIMLSGLLAVLLALVGPSAADAAGTNILIHSFSGKADGLFPISPLLVLKSGRLYGTTFNGGKSKTGQAFVMAPPAAGVTSWTKATIFSFGGGQGVTAPFGGLIGNPGAALFGSSVDGGGVSCGQLGCGTVYELSRTVSTQPLKLTILHAFNGTTDGQSPIGELVQNSAGMLFGVAANGGKTSCDNGAGCGTVYALTPPAAGGTVWGFQAIYTFTGGSDGSVPNGKLLLDSTGALFGSTYSGGASGLGTVFQLTPRIVIFHGIRSTFWLKTILHSFAGGSDGAHPNSGLFGGTGDLRGTTQAGGGSAACTGGCGTVFELRQLESTSALYTISIMHSFTSDPDGSTPLAGLFRDASGAFWGTASVGGSPLCDGGCGTIFKLTPSRLLINHYSYSQPFAFLGGDQGANPQCALAADGAGALYGVLQNGGLSSGGGVFQFTPQ